MFRFFSRKVFRRLPREQLFQISQVLPCAAQVRRQDSVTEGAEINFGGAREIYLCEF